MKNALPVEYDDHALKSKDSMIAIYRCHRGNGKFSNSGSVHGENGGVTRDGSVGQGIFANTGGSCDADTSHSSIPRNRLDFMFQQETNSFVPAPWSAALTEHVQAVFNAALQKALKTVSPSSVP